MFKVSEISDKIALIDEIKVLKEANLNLSKTNTKITEHYENLLTE